MTTAYSYVRFSSKPQERGDSLRRQTALARKYADEHGLALVESSYQDLGISAFKGKNAVEGALAAFLKAVDDGIIKRGSFLLVESMDRISRQQLDEALELFLSIIRRGITIVTLQDRQVYSKEKIKEDKGLSLIISIMVMSRAHEESATKSTRIKEAWSAKRADGGILTAMGPAWLKLDREKREWVEITEHVKTVQYIFDLARQGHGSPAISGRLTIEGVPTLKSAAMWSAQLVSHVLKNPAVTGWRNSPKAKQVPNVREYPQIISDTLFMDVQQRISDRTAKGGRGQHGNSVANLFAGLMYCTCGAKLRYVSAQKDRKYMQCVVAYGKGDCDATRKIPYVELEQSVMDWLYRNIEISEGENDVVDPTASIRSDMAMKQQQLDNLTKAIESLGDDPVSMTTLARRVGTLERELIDLEASLDRVVAPEIRRSIERDARLLFRRHRDLVAAAQGVSVKAVKAQREAFELRVQLQSEIKRVLTRIVARKELLFVDAQSKRVDDHVPGGGTCGAVELYGKVVDTALERVPPSFYKQKKFKNVLENGVPTPDGKGLFWFYQHAAWGINGTRKRKAKPT